MQSINERKLDVYLKELDRLGGILEDDPSRTDIEEQYHQVENSVNWLQCYTNVKFNGSPGNYKLTTKGAENKTVEEMIK